MKRRKIILLSSLFLAVGAILMFRNGCGDTNPDGRIAVSGKVNYLGKPLSSGRIIFAPTKESSGLSSVGLIEEGQFRIEPALGPTAGEYNISVIVGKLPSKKGAIGTKTTEKSDFQKREQKYNFLRTIKNDNQNILELNITPE